MKCVMVNARGFYRHVTVENISLYNNRKSKRKLVGTSFTSAVTMPTSSLPLLSFIFCIACFSFSRAHGCSDSSAGGEGGCGSLDNKIAKDVANVSVEGAEHDAYREKARTTCVIISPNKTGLISFPVLYHIQRFLQSLAFMYAYAFAKVNVIFR